MNINKYRNVEISKYQHIDTSTRQNVRKADGRARGLAATHALCARPQRMGSAIMFSNGRSRLTK